VWLFCQSDFARQLTVKATVTVREVFAGKRRCVLDAVCAVNGKTVTEGESTMYCTTAA